MVQWNWNKTRCQSRLLPFHCDDVHRKTLTLEILNVQAYEKITKVQNDFIYCETENVTKTLFFDKDGYYHFESEKYYPEKTISKTIRKIDLKHIIMKNSCTEDLDNFLESCIVNMVKIEKLVIRDISKEIVAEHFLKAIEILRPEKITFCIRFSSSKKDDILLSFTSLIQKNDKLKDIAFDVEKEREFYTFKKKIIVPPYAQLDLLEQLRKNERKKGILLRTFKGYDRHFTRICFLEEKCKQFEHKSIFVRFFMRYLIDPDPIYYFHSDPPYNTCYIVLPNFHNRSLEVRCVESLESYKPKYKNCFQSPLFFPIIFIFVILWFFFLMVLLVPDSRSKQKPYTNSTFIANHTSFS